MKKKLLIIIGALVAVAAIVAGSVFGTIAYLTSASKVSNVFTVGNVFITLDESAVNDKGVIPEGSTERTDRNSYHLVPGNSYDKDPRITVDANTESCYLFLVTRNQITNIEVQDDPVNKPTMAQQMVANGWGIYKDTTAGSRVWVYCGTKANVNADTKAAVTPVAVCGANRTASEAGVYSVSTIDIFKKFHIVTTETANLSIYSGAEVTINAVGIQSDSFGTIGDMSSIDKAWAAVVNQFPYIQDTITTGENNG